MGLELEAWTDAGHVRGIALAAGAARDVVEAGPQVTLERASIGALAPPGTIVAHRAVGTLHLELDDLLVVAAPPDPGAHVHAQWHAIRLGLGRYLVEGELPTLPGFDPGRALARPTGTFVHLRDVRVAVVDAPGRDLARLPGALVNRYAVDAVDADILLVHFFPGAAAHVDTTRTGAAV